MLDDLGRALLVAVDLLTRDTYGDTNGDAVMNELDRMGHSAADTDTLDNLFDQLREDGYLTLGERAFGGPEAIGRVRLTADGRKEAREVDPFERTYGEARHAISSLEFARCYPAAFESWAAAERLLWRDPTATTLTTIGHGVREAMQSFATALVEAHRPADVNTDISQVEKRLGAVIAMHRPRLGVAHREALEALGTLWTKTNRLVQRQEHGAQKEGEPLAWSDARRIVWLSMFCMNELRDTFDGLRLDSRGELEGSR